MNEEAIEDIYHTVNRIEYMLILCLIGMTIICSLILFFVL